MRNEIVLYRTQWHRMAVREEDKSFTRFFQKIAGSRGRAPVAPRTGQNTPSVFKRHPQMAQSPGRKPQGASPKATVPTP